jgi:hypothetical protein
MLDELQPPLGMNEEKNYNEKIKYINSLRLSTFKAVSEYNFYDVLHKISKEIITK